MFEELMAKLPDELKHHVLSYTYNPQPKILLADIIHFQFSYHLMQVWYKNSYQTISNYHATQINNQIFVYDLFEYFSHSIPLGVQNYTEKMSQIWKRFPRIKEEKQFSTMFETFVDKNVESQLRIFWGILTPVERNDFIYSNSSIDTERHLFV